MEERLGGGASADVWLAQEALPDGSLRRLALKVLRPGGLSARGAFEAFLDEARIAGTLDDPNLVRVHGIAQIDGNWVVAMEWVDGTNLAELLAWLRAVRMQLPRSVVLDIAIAVASGLVHAHHARDHRGRRLQIVHRDLKPANILIGRAGEVKVADFGIAKATVNISSTLQGEFKGSPPFVAPETWLGEREFLPRVDLFAFGAILWEMVMGRRLFDAAVVPQIAVLVTGGSAEEDAQPILDIFPELAPLIEGLLRRDPEERTQDARSLLRPLRRLRAAVDAPGDLGDFMHLLELAMVPRVQRPPSSRQLTLPDTTDVDWQSLVSAVRGETPTLPPLNAVDPELLPGGASARTDHRIPAFYDPILTSDSFLEDPSEVSERYRLITGAFPPVDDTYDGSEDETIKDEEDAPPVHRSEALGLTPAK